MNKIINKPRFLKKNKKITSHKLPKSIYDAIILGLFGFFMLLNLLEIIVIHIEKWRNIPIDTDYIMLMKRWAEGIWKTMSAMLTGNFFAEKFKK